MQHKILTVCKANKVVEAGYKLSLNEQRVVLACIGQVDSTKKLLATDEFELFAKDFAKLFSVSDDRPKVKRLEMRWISSIKHLPDDGKVILMFAQDTLPFLSEIKNTFFSQELSHRH